MDGLYSDVVSGVFSLQKLDEGMSAWHGKVHYIRFLLFFTSKDSMSVDFSRPERGQNGEL